MENISDWLANSIRFTFFASSDSSYCADDLWEKLAKQPFETKREENRQQSISFEGDFETYKLTMEVHRIDNRINCLFAPDEPEFVLAGEIPHLGSFPGCASQFLTLVAEWLQLDIPLSYRVALGAVLSQPVSSVRASFGMLSAHLGLEFDASSTSDLMYRINRRRLSTTVSGVTVNRVATWSNPDVNIEVKNQSGQQVKFANHHTCRLELDINNVPSDRTFDASESTELLSEFLKLGTEIAERGDIL